MNQEKIKALFDYDPEEFQPSGRAQNVHAESGSSNLPAALESGFSHGSLDQSLGNSNADRAGATVNHKPTTTS